MIYSLKNISPDSQITKDFSSQSTNILSIYVVRNFHFICFSFSINSIFSSVTSCKSCIEKFSFESKKISNLKNENLLSSNKKVC